MDILNNIPALQNLQWKVEEALNVWKVWADELVSSGPWEKDDALLLREAQKDVKDFLLSTNVDSVCRQHST